MLELWDEVLVQRYIDGREVNVGILGDTVLPIAEIDFSKHAARPLAHRDVSIQVGDRQRRRPRRRAALPGPTSGQGRERSASRRAARLEAVPADSATGGSTCASMRTASRGSSRSNANPDIAPDAGLARMARVAGIEYSRAHSEYLRARARPRP